MHTSVISCNTQLVTKIKNRTVSYGCVVTNTKVKPEDTTAYRELSNMNLGAETIIDVVNVNVKKRPKLEQLLEELSFGDRIFISDISELLGATNKADIYYQKALDKGIEIYIVDFTKSLFSLHPMSIISPKIKYEDETLQIDKVSALNKFREFAQNYKYNRSGRRAVFSMPEIDLLWQDVYFKYEAYLCNFETALKELEPLGIKNYATFVKRALEYEHYYGYADDVLKYCKENPNFINTPKRIVTRQNGIPVLPSEYICITNMLNNYGIQAKIDNNDLIEKLGVENFFRINFPVYKRYENLDKFGAKRTLK